MPDEVVVALITGVLTLAGSAGLWSWLHARAERPIKQQELEHAEFAQVTTSYDKLVERLEGRVEKLEQQAKDDRQELSNQGKQIRELREEVTRQSTINHRLRLALSSALAYIEDLHRRWDYYRAQPTPPPHERHPVDTGQER